MTKIIFVMNAVTIAIMIPTIQCTSHRQVAMGVAGLALRRAVLKPHLSMARMKILLSEDRLPRAAAAQRTRGLVVSGRLIVTGRTVVHHLLGTGIASRIQRIVRLRKIIEHLHDRGASLEMRSGLIQRAGLHPKSRVIRNVSERIQRESPRVDIVILLSTLVGMLTWTNLSNQSIGIGMQNQIQVLRIPFHGIARDSRHRRIQMLMSMDPLVIRIERSTRVVVERLHIRVMGVGIVVGIDSEHITIGR